MSIQFSQIESAKENILPLRRGRTAGSLSAALAEPVSKRPADSTATPSTNTLSTFKENGGTSGTSAGGSFCHVSGAVAAAVRQFDSDLDAISLSDDPLAVVERNLRSLEDAGATRPVLRTHFERGTRAFLDARRYRTDVRYLAMWIRYAELCGGEVQLQCYQFLASQQIGRYSAKFYEAYADVLEALGRTTDADQVYAQGIQEAAEPLARLKASQREFHARMMRKPVAAAAARGPSAGPLRAPSGLLDENGGRQPVARVGANAGRAPTVGGQPTRAANATGRQGTLGGGRAGAPGGAATNFSVFTESSSAMAATSAATTTNSLFPTGGVELPVPDPEIAAKENLAGTQKWTSVRIPTGKVPASTAAARRAAPGPFAVYEDPAPGSLPAAPVALKSRVRRILRGGREMIEEIQYDPNLIRSDKEEFSFEEVRAALMYYPSGDGRADESQPDADGATEHTTTMEITLSSFPDQHPPPSSAAQVAQALPTTPPRANNTSSQPDDFDDEDDTTRPLVMRRRSVLPGSRRASSIASGGSSTRSLRARSRRSMGLGGGDTTDLGDLDGLTGEAPFVDDACGVTLHTEQAMNDVMAMFAAETTTDLTAQREPLSSARLGGGSSNNIASTSTNTGGRFGSGRFGGSVTTSAGAARAGTAGSTSDGDGLGFEIFCEDTTDIKAASDLAAQAAADSTTSFSSLAMRPDGRTPLAPRAPPALVSREPPASSTSAPAPVAATPASSTSQRRAKTTTTTSSSSSSSSTATLVEAPVVEPYAPSHMSSLFAERSIDPSTLTGVVDKGTVCLESGPRLRVGQRLAMFGIALTVERLLGEGGFGTVWLAAASNKSRHRQYALKVQERSFAERELYVQSVLRDRLDPDSHAAIATFHFAELYADLGIIAMSFMQHGSLQDLVNSHRSSGLRVDEAVTLHLASQATASLAMVHGADVLHCDVKPDNFMVVLEPSSASTQGHARINLQLVDYGRSIDRALYAPFTTFRGGETLSGFACPQQEAGEPWAETIDYAGLAGTLHVLCFQRYLEDRKDPSTQRRRPSTKIPRYWKACAVWQSVFDELLNEDEVGLDTMAETLSELITGTGRLAPTLGPALDNVAAMLAKR